MLLYEWANRTTGEIFEVMANIVASNFQWTKKYGSTRFRGNTSRNKKLEENSAIKNNLKATHKDRTHTITKALILFCDSARSVKPPVPITVESISVKAQHIGAKLLVAVHQPMDQGIIQAVKRKNHDKLLSKVFKTIEHRDEL